MTVDELREIDLPAEQLGRYLYTRTSRLLREGVPRDVIQSVLTEYYAWLGEQGRDEDQDAVADVVDSLVGFSSPGSRL